MLELGAGIGRFTGELAKTAGHVLAMDFIESAIKKVSKFSPDLRRYVEYLKCNRLLLISTCMLFLVHRDLF